MEIPRLGVQLELQLQAYATATVISSDLSRSCNLHHRTWQCQTLNPLSGARDRTHVLMDTSWVCYCWATMGTPRNHFLVRRQHVYMHVWACMCMCVCWLDLLPLPSLPHTSFEVFFPLYPHTALSGTYEFIPRDVFQCFLIIYLLIYLFFVFLLFLGPLPRHQCFFRFLYRL